MSFSPNLGRWLQDDPIGFEAGDANLYRFVGNSPTDYTDPSGLQKQKNGDDLFREAGKRNNVPDNIIDTILATAKSTKSETPGLLGSHNYCEQWADTFSGNLNKALNEQGHKNGLKDASGGGITGPLDKTVFFVPAVIAYYDQDHTAMKITFKDGTTFYIDCSTISSTNINNLTGGPSHIGLPSQIPPEWEQYPLKNPPKTQVTGTNAYGGPVFKTEGARWHHRILDALANLGSGGSN